MNIVIIIKKRSGGKDATGDFALGSSENINYIFLKTNHTSHEVFFF